MSGRLLGQRVIVLGGKAHGCALDLPDDQTHIIDGGAVLI